MLMKTAKFIFLNYTLYPSIKSVITNSSAGLLAANIAVHYVKE